MPSTMDKVSVERKEVESSLCCELGIQGSALTQNNTARLLSPVAREGVKLSAVSPDFIPQSQSGAKAALKPSFLLPKVTRLSQSHTFTSTLRLLPRIAHRHDFSPRSSLCAPSISSPTFHTSLRKSIRCCSWTIALLCHLSHRSRDHFIFYAPLTAPTTA